MTLFEAWKLFGYDLNIIITNIKNMNDINDRLNAIRNEYENIRKKSKTLLAKYHPDRHNNDELYTEKFKMIKEAVDVIKLHTEEFEEKVNLNNKSDNRINKNSVIIQIIK